ncbi:MAG: glycogen synthase GlgA [Myxococcota bacterium]
MKIAHVTAEVVPWSKTGGLGDVAGALPKAQAREGAQVGVFAPFHREARHAAERHGLQLRPTGVGVRVHMGGADFTGTFLEHSWPDGSTTYLFDAPRFFDRHGLYVDENGRDYEDNGFRYAVFCQAVLQAARRLMGGVPDVFHAHDWQAALIPMYLRHAPVPTVLTIHNLAYQGVFHKGLLPAIGLDWSIFNAAQAEHYDRFGMLKGGIATADAVTTVSPNYAVEITTERFGHGLHHFIRNHARRLRGIINGVDEDDWSPRVDPHIASRYSSSHLDGKADCRASLQQEFGLQVNPGEPVLASISRFTHQKGIDLLADIAPRLEQLGAHLIILGTGDAALEDRLRWLDSRHQRLAVQVDFNVPLAHRITAGADMILMPSRFEPCGLNQMYGMAYGTIPVVHATGGLRDTVEHDVTGFLFEIDDAAGLWWALERAIERYRSQHWHYMMMEAMSRDFSWRGPADEYLNLYRELKSTF